MTKYLEIVLKESSRKPAGCLERHRSDKVYNPLLSFLTVCCIL